MTSDTSTAPPPATPEETPDSSRNARLAKAGVGVAIGSAAVAAALLYAGRLRKK